MNNYRARRLVDFLRFTHSGTSSFDAAVATTNAFFVPSTSSGLGTDLNAATSAAMASSLDSILALHADSSPTPDLATHHLTSMDRTANTAHVSLVTSCRDIRSIGT